MIVLDREDELEELRRLLACVLPNTWIIPVSSPMTAIEIVDAPDGPHLDLLVIGGSTPLLLDVVSRARRHQPDLPALVLRSEDAALERREGCSVLRSSYSPNDLVDEVLSMLMPELSDQGGQDPGTRC